MHGNLSFNACDMFPLDFTLLYTVNNQFPIFSPVYLVDLTSIEYVGDYLQI